MSPRHPRFSLPTSKNPQSRFLPCHAVALGCLAALLVTGVLPAQSARSSEMPKEIAQFLGQHCYDCHQGEEAEAGLNLASWPHQLVAKDVDRWAGLYDRVRREEMPPADSSEVTSAERNAFLTSLNRWLSNVESAHHQQVGRVRGRRLTNLQLERTLQDLLAIDIPLASQMPEEPRTNGFPTVADGQAMSHYQLANHLQVVDAALDEAFRRALGRDDEWSRQLSARDVARRQRQRRCREPEMLRGMAVTWSGGVIFYGRLPATTAKVDGWYRFTIKASALNPPADYGVWCTVRSGACISSAPLLAWVGAFEVGKDPKEVTFEAWLPAGHMLEVRPGDLTLKRARFNGGQIGVGEGEPQNVPGVGIHSVKMERIHHGFVGNDRVREKLFGDMEVAASKRNDAGFRLLTKQPKADVAQLVTAFAGRAFRRPLAGDTAQPFIEVAHAALDDGASLEEALQNAYRAILCSSRFLYFQERPGPLDGFAIANRLSYLLWNTMPDEELIGLARQGKLGSPDVLREQVSRLLQDAKGEKFVVDLADEWLDLRLIDFTEPDRKLYPGFDVIVQQSMLDETRAFLQEMLDENLSVENLIDSDFTFLNSRLARYYGIDSVKGDHLRQVKLKPADHRGGVLTHGSVLKVTANGTDTSPVLRGVWVSERLLGEAIPPPPENVPAIEPDVRGAKTIRELLAKHIEIESCATCHRRMDPPGFALEHYDPSGRWRNSYSTTIRKRRRAGPPIDPSGQFRGKDFADLQQFRQLAIADSDRIASNVLEKLLTYGTGAPIYFSDRAEVDRMVQQLEAEHELGFRTIVEAAVTSRIFTSK